MWIMVSEFRIETAHRELAEDEPILNTIRFKPGVMVASDRHLSRYYAEHAADWFGRAAVLY